VALVGLDDLLQHGALVQQVGEARHVRRIQEVDFQEELVADVVAEEGHALDERNVADELRGGTVVGVAPVGDGEGVVDGEAEVVDVLVDCACVSIGSMMVLICAEA
jgi:hypothetical protein